MNDLDFTGMSIAERNAFTVGELMAPLLNPDWREGNLDIDYYRPYVATADLMKLAEVGKRMLFDAIYVADEQNDATFFEEAFSHYGRVIYEALIEMDLPNRCTLCGVLMPHTDECSHRRTGNQ